MGEVDVDRLVQIGSVLVVVVMLLFAAVGITFAAVRIWRSRKLNVGELVSPEDRPAPGKIGTISAPEGLCVVCEMATASECWPGYKVSSADMLDWSGHRQLHQSAPMYVVADVGRTSLCSRCKRVAVRLLESELGGVRADTAKFNATNEARLSNCEMTLLARLQIDCRRALEALHSAVLAATASDQPVPQLPSASRASVTLMPTKEPEDQ